MPTGSAGMTPDGQPNSTTPPQSAPDQSTSGQSASGTATDLATQPATPDAPTPASPRTHRMRRRIITAIAVVVVIALASALASVSVNYQRSAAQSAITKHITQVYTKEYQAKAAADLAAKKKAGTYTEDRMLTVENPYGTNTTSLYVYFTTQDAVSVTYTVTAEGYPDFTATAYQAKTYQKTHEFTVLGLIPNAKNTIIFTLKTASGKSVTKTITHRMGSLLGWEETRVTLTKENTSTKLGNGLYAILGNDSEGQDYMFYYDDNGVLRGEIPILYYRSHRLLFKNGIMYFSVSTHDIVGMNRLGRIVKWYSTGSGYILHHDYVMDADGNFVVLATKTGLKTMQDYIIKIDATTGKVSKLLDMGELFGDYRDAATFASLASGSGSTTCNADNCATKKDWIHLNTIQMLPDGDAIVSSRETSTIIRINDLEGTPSIESMIGESTFWKGTGYEKYLMTKDTSDGDWPSTGGQHTVTYEEDDSLKDGQYFLYMFDNNYGFSPTRPEYDWAANVEDIETKATSGTKSYYYKYLVDTKANTYKLVRSITVPYSSVVSSAQEYEDGTVITDSGKQGIWGVYGPDGTLIAQYKMKTSKTYIYRVFKYDFEGFYFAKG